MTRQNALIHGAALLCAIGSSIGILLGYHLRTSETFYEELSASNNAVAETIYIEVPYVYYDEDFKDEVRKQAYEDYMLKLTDDNAEAWWYGYNIMTEGWDNEPEHITDHYSQEDLNYLYSCVETEVYGGDFLSKAHIAMVIFNRLEEGVWGSSLKEIITKPNQFAYGAHPASKQTIQACAFAFEMHDMTQGAIAFHSGTKSNTFWGKEYIFTDSCGHHFYK